MCNGFYANVKIFFVWLRSRYSHTQGRGTSKHDVATFMLLSLFRLHIFNDVLLLFDGDMDEWRGWERLLLLREIAERNIVSWGLLMMNTGFYVHNSQGKKTTIARVLKVFQVLLAWSEIYISFISQVFLSFNFFFKFYLNRKILFYELYWII